ncbi:hypothetical protein V497_08271 [Pseudogymnoascus sp. VKM F-4516 (FW-969)]|nr:hypothetical protein V497_08271 [Pseudogymnoascus sp. VKM F-4516 (FW-969)]
MSHVATNKAKADKALPSIEDDGKSGRTRFVMRRTRQSFSNETEEIFKIFVIGITGFIGGTVTRRIIDSHPEFEIAALVRNEKHIVNVSTMFPKVRIVRGSLDDRDILIEECSKARIVLQMATDHQEGISSIIEGLRSGNEKDYAYLVHTSDVLALADMDFALGECDGRLYDDIADLDMIKERLSNNLRNTDIMIMNAATQNTEDRRPLRTAIIYPSAIYGFGKGPVSKRGGKMTALMRAIMLRKSAFKVENGKNLWSMVDIESLADSYLVLVEKALSSISPDNVDKGNWNSEGLYVIETEELKRFFVDEPSVVQKLTANEVDDIYPRGSSYWGTNARCIGSRMRLIGWNGGAADLDEYVDERLGYEIEDLYGITLEEQEIEAAERRPSPSPDASPAIESSVESTGQGNNSSTGPSMEIDSPVIQNENRSAVTVTSDDDASMEGLIIGGMAKKGKKKEDEQRDELARIEKEEIKEDERIKEGEGKEAATEEDEIKEGAQELEEEGEWQEVHRRRKKSTRIGSGAESVSGAERGRGAGSGTSAGRGRDAGSGTSAGRGTSAERGRGAGRGASTGGGTSAGRGRGTGGGTGVGRGTSTRGGANAGRGRGTGGGTGAGRGRGTGGGTGAGRGTSIGTGTEMTLRRSPRKRKGRSGGN